MRRRGSLPIGSEEEPVDGRLHRRDGMVHRQRAGARARERMQTELFGLGHQHDQRMPVEAVRPGVRRAERGTAPTPPPPALWWPSTAAPSRPRAAGRNSARCRPKARPYDVVSSVTRNTAGWITARRSRTASYNERHLRTGQFSQTRACDGRVWCEAMRRARASRPPPSLTRAGDSSTFPSVR